mmetsp:Transcript_7978/g.20107  ORF Transcript_7978/g.20107 Transcript_7978/m.20107 type:complete len:197 (+) Transcript_7978:479-1069(+)|eukprot:CAMPEP_0177687726 /NCGR_PEP_ID=MMETSP0447-20121125/34285_1 /TAXON_ID=0 /ORGANISM="Stygamoeba regulata, Strain BSH-02190019" /LENGTH=196 /DNA_ID=CAMNT_0019197993 /DNA_START=386 /DNA_END=976 /DNA_ORIENTATION=-
MPVEEYKITVLGDGAVGKTALTIQFCSNHFVEYYDPTIESSYRRQIQVDDSVCMLEILDTAGQQEYTALLSQWITYGDAFLLLYSITDHQSFERVAWIKEKILQAKDINDVDSADCPPLILIGNKADLAEKRQVSQEEGRDLAQRIRAEFFETSALTRQNVEEAFFAAVRKIRVLRLPKETEKIQKKPKKGGCVLL